MLAIGFLWGNPFVWEGGWRGNYACNNYLSGINFPCGSELAHTIYKAAKLICSARVSIRKPYKALLACRPLLHWFLWRTSSSGKGDGGGIMHAITSKRYQFPLWFQNCTHKLNINYKAAERGCSVYVFVRRPYKALLAYRTLFLWLTRSSGEGDGVEMIYAITI